MNSRMIPLALAIPAAMHVPGAAMAAAQAQAQARSPDQDGVVQVDPVTVTGCRASLEESQAVKRNADSILDAISAEDIGEFPDIDAAESLSHLPGINANYTYTESSTSSDLFLPYVSEHAYTITPYHEKGPYSVRLNYSWRSEYFTQIGRQSANVYTDAYKQLDMTLGDAFNAHVGPRLSATNLLDDTYYSYDTDPRVPLGLYRSGRNYQAAHNVKF